jgi:translation initiation factor IF-2
MLSPRPPIVVILGHVDHGKTSLLDALRKTNLVAREAGGITQHIRSFQLQTSTQPITFIDTPGHSAFAAMRSRGSQLADIAILVVSGVDGVMPQTVESINFIKSANIPFLVAITKSDLSTFDAQKVKTQLLESDVVVEDMGGQVSSLSISAKTGQGLPELIELISLQNELTPVQADPDAHLQAIVLESRLDPRRGPLAVVIGKSGTLTVGQSLFTTSPMGKIKALINPEGQKVSSALPSVPVEILGLTHVPPVGSVISSTLQSVAPSAPLSKPTRQPATDIKLKLILRADVLGSLEAIVASLPAQVQLLLAETGEVTESDVLLAKTSQAKVIAFNTKLSPSVVKLAQTEKVTVTSFQIIYELLDSVNLLLNPKPTDLVTGEATIVALFKINGELVAGCKCISGQISKSDQIKVVRSTQVLAQSRVKSLRLGKVECTEIKAGQEFGVVLKPQVAFQVGDAIIACSTNHG